MDWQHASQEDSTSPQADTRHTHACMHSTLTTGWVNTQVASTAAVHAGCACPLLKSVSGLEKYTRLKVAWLQPRHRFTAVGGGGMHTQSELSLRVSNTCDSVHRRTSREEQMLTWPVPLLRSDVWGGAASSLLPVSELLLLIGGLSFASGRDGATSVTTQDRQIKAHPQLPSPSSNHSPPLEPFLGARGSSYPHRPQPFTPKQLQIQTPLNILLTFFSSSLSLYFWNLHTSETAARKALKCPTAVTGDVAWYFLHLTLFSFLLQLCKYFWNQKVSESI